MAFVDAHCAYECVHKTNILIPHLFNGWVESGWRKSGWHIVTAFFLKYIMSFD